MPLFLQTICVTFGMFSILPVPRIQWNEKNLRFAFVSLPLVGAVIGLCTALWAFFCSHFGIPPILRGAVASILPAVLTGGFHLDGFADTSDALASHAEPERKQQILKDSHVGAFALIRICEYFVLNFALFSALLFETHQICMWCGCLVLSRALSGYAICTLPLSKNSGLAHTFQSAADKELSGRLLLVWCVLSSVWIFYFGGFSALLLPLGAALLSFYFRNMAKHEFGGVSGDLGGWFIQTTELLLAMLLVLLQYLF